MLLKRKKKIKEDVRIHIGEYYASSKPVTVCTVLGSCVAVCLHDPVNKIGGMNHILLPETPDFQKYNPSARFGVNAMELLINGLLKLGAKKSNLVGKAFGGAHLFDEIPIEKGIGKKVIEFVENFLHNENIKLISKDFGGYVSRKIYFQTDTGIVYLKRGSGNILPGITRAEKREKEKLHRQEKHGDITLF